MVVETSYGIHHEKATFSLSPWISLSFFCLENLFTSFVITEAVRGGEEERKADKMR